MPDLVMFAAALLAAAVATAKPVDVAFDTTAGTFVIRVDTAHAPITASNFLHNVMRGRYANGSIYRTVDKHREAASFEVIQGGVGPSGDPGVTPITLEPTTKTGLHNDDGAVAMARTNDPNSATTEFFVDLGDARFLDGDGPLAPGYAVFGHVVRGMDVVRKIHEGSANGELLSPPVRFLHVHILK
ncbi:MAG: peptidylprolyl isomerase [Vulcanimicrobiaceae bacterium]